jgi:hypothetical protein
MAPIKKQNQATICAKLTGSDGAMEAMEIERTGMDTIANPGTDITPVYGPGEYGQATVVTTNDTAPGDLPSTTVTVYEEGSIDYLMDQQSKLAVFPVQRQWNPRGTSRSNLTIWESIDHIGRCRVTDAPIGGGPGIPFSGDAVTVPRTVKGEYAFRVKWGSLSALTTGESEDILDIAMLSELSTVPGYPGPDQILVAIAAAGSGVSANTLISVNGGGSWSTLGTDPLGTDEHPKHVVLRFINNTQFRMIVLRATADGSNPPEIAYSDQTLGAETTVSWSHVNVNSTNNQAGEAMAWLFPNRLYVAAAGDVYLSTNFGVSFSTTMLYTGSTVINGFVTGADKAVYAFGASNLLLREAPNRAGGFSAVTGPTGTDASTSMAVIGREEDMTLLLGNGTSVFRCKKPQPTTAGDWTELNDFGAAVTSIMPAKTLQAPYGDPDCFFVTVDDTVGGLWFTRDGGQTWREVTELSNTGYNKAVISTFSPNLAFIACDDGAIHKYLGS